MSASLLDVNVLIALHWENHSHHQAAIRWFSSHQAEGWATCPTTEAGFVRVISNPATDASAPSAASALELLKDSLGGNPHHQFWPDAIPLAAISGAVRTRIAGHNQVTDAYLLSLAIHRKARLVTFDRGLQSLAPKGSAEERALWLLT
ncbi:MAG TPA: TA system VapC family ribonuclease toxin [Terracidiphilus sp.]|nr:TA system VapC family ribonuclease toxin [Terracidiphilus sp.]